MKRTLTALFALALAASTRADGAATYASKCSICHGKEGQGTKMSPKPIAGTSAEEVKKTVTEGKGKMKPVKIDDVDAVARYVAGLKK